MVRGTGSVERWPARPIDVCSFGEESDVRLVDGTPASIYVTLSHCWGGAQTSIFYTCLADLVAN